MAKRVLVERLRPQTQQEVVVRPVDTYERPAPVQEGSLTELSRFVQRLEPRFSKLMQAKNEQQKAEDKANAREIAERETAAYDELVKSGKIGAEESPVFRFAFNETRGETQGYEFIQEASEAYSRDTIAGATDASGFDEWYQQYYSNYVDNNQDVLGGDGAYGTFSRVAGQARNNLLNSHLSNVKKNFAAAQSAAYDNWVFNSLDQADLTTPEGQIALRDSFNIKQGDLAASGGPEYSYTKLNSSTVDAVISYHAANDFDIVGLERTLGTLSGGTGPLGGTAYAREQIAEARVTFAKERIAAEQREESYRTINESRTKDNIDGIFWSEFMDNNYNVDAIYDSLDPQQKADMAEFYPEGIGELLKASQEFQAKRFTEPMHPAAEADIRQQLEALNPAQRVQRVIDLTKQGRITDTGSMNRLMSWASSSRAAAEKGINVDATKDPIYKDFFEREFKANTDKYTGDNTNRLYYFQSSFYEVFDEVDEDGNRTWDTFSAARKLQIMNGIMKEVNTALDQSDQTLFENTSNTIKPKLGRDGKPMIINGNVVYERSTMN